MDTRKCMCTSQAALETTERDLSEAKKVREMKKKKIKAQRDLSEGKGKKKVRALPGRARVHQGRVQSRA
jgi:hypothetical protein